MPHREFVDESGVHWEVWLTTPMKPERRFAPPGSVPPAVDRRTRHEYRVPLGKRWIHGWLTFRSETEETKRMAPFPRQWAGLTDRQLAVLLELAEASPESAGPREDS